MEPNNAKPIPSPLLTVKQVADILQWNAYTVSKKAEKGELPAFKLGREWRFRQEDLMAWIDAKRREGRPKKAGNDA
jgi:excisionase family DNA binding protein